ncbi:MAG TPA: Gfo/Idh/MocA family oxidoreductase [Candidatus Sulfotelmatobacter sp.]|nr:Gfo/Idh/MocA family oxidoreductase [Candidatus Sulfotelmatobacter sp.]
MATRRPAASSGSAAMTGATLALEGSPGSAVPTGVLALTSFPLAPAEAALLERLQQFPPLNVLRGTAGESEDGCEVALLLDSGFADAHLHPAEAHAEELAGFVRAGGRLVVVGTALDVWGRSAAGQQLGIVSGGRLAPATSLRVATERHPLGERFDEEFIVHDRLPLELEPPRGATVLLSAHWQMRRLPVAYGLPVGRGEVICLALGRTDAAAGDENLLRFLFRCLRVGLSPQPLRLGVGLLGYGAIAAEHVAALEAVSGLHLAAVCDRVEEKLEPARRAGAAGYRMADELLADSDVDVVVVGTPPTSHTELTMRALRAGKHVICEKPLALRGGDVDRMRAAARASQRMLTVYQNRRWDADFLTLEDAVLSGAIGEPFYVESFVGGYSQPCRFWHSDQQLSGGTIYDWGAHYLDWLLRLIDGEAVRVTACGHKRVWFDVTNHDQVRVDIDFADGRQASFLHSDVAAAPKPKWYVLGTRGAILGEWRRELVRSRLPGGEVVEEPVPSTDLGATVKLLLPGGGGSTHEELLAAKQPPRFAFYRNVADHLAFGEELAVRPEQCRRTVAIMEAATLSLENGGEPVAL